MVPTSGRKPKAVARRKILLGMVLLPGVLIAGALVLFRPGLPQERSPDPGAALEEWRLEPSAHLDEVCRILIGDPEKSAEAAAAFLRCVASADRGRDCLEVLIQALAEDDRRSRPRLTERSAPSVRHVLFVSTDLTPGAIAAAEDYVKEAVSSVHRALIESLGSWPAPIADAQVGRFEKLLAGGDRSSDEHPAKKPAEPDLSDPEARRIAIQVLLRSAGDVTRIGEFRSTLAKLLEQETLEDVIDAMARVFDAKMGAPRSSGDTLFGQTAGTEIGLVLRRHPNETTTEFLAYRLRRSDSVPARRMMIVALGVSGSTNPMARIALKEASALDGDRDNRRTALVNFGTIAEPEDVVPLCKEGVERPLRTLDDILDASSALGALGNLAAHRSEFVAPGTEVVRKVLSLPADSFHMPLIVQACSSRFVRFHRLLRDEIRVLAKSENSSIRAAAQRALRRIGE